MRVEPHRTPGVSEHRGAFDLERRRSVEYAATVDSRGSRRDGGHSETSAPREIRLECYGSAVMVTKTCSRFRHQTAKFHHRSRWREDEPNESNRVGDLTAQLSSFRSRQRFNFRPISLP